MHASINAGAAVTYEFSGGRFGDNILAYLHALWISHQYKIPLLYKPFKYSEQLCLHTAHEHFEAVKKNKKIKVLSRNDMAIDPQANIIYEVPYFSQVLLERHLPWNRHWIDLDINWLNPEFHEKARNYVKPINAELFHIDLPHDALSIAVHVRKGSKFDGPLLGENRGKKDDEAYADINVPLKFPPEYYYVDQLKTISKLCNNQKMYVFIFTDYEDIPALVARLQGELQDYANIEFDYRKATADNCFDSYVLEDFFAMIQFDYFIGGQSNFSIIASKIAQYKIQILPIQHHWSGNVSIIDAVETIIKRQGSPV